MSLFGEVFVALDRAGARFVVAGGTAVVLHGHARMTLDLDLFIDLEPAAARRAIEALTGIGLVPRLPVDAIDFADPEVRQRWVSEKNMRVFSLVDPRQPMRIVDLFAENDVPFDVLWERADVMVIGEVRVRVASIPDLIRMKTAAGRAVDREDVRVLEEILGRSRSRKPE